MDNTSPQDGLALFSEFLACLGVGSELVGTFSLGLGGFGWMRGEGDREAQLGPNPKQARLGEWVWTGTRAILATTGRRTDVCLSSEVEWMVSRADLWSNAVLASGEAVLLRGQAAD